MSRTRARICASVRLATGWGMDTYSNPGKP